MSEQCGSQGDDHLVPELTVRRVTVHVPHTG
jgi:hypothetical protein